MTFKHFHLSASVTAMTVFGFLFLISPAYAAEEFTYDRLVGIVRYLAGSALILGGVIAMAAIVFYGLRMTLSKGDPTKFNDAKKQLIKAAIGAALIFGVYTVINTIQGAADSIAK